MSKIRTTIENVRDSIADLEGEHYVMCGRPVDREAWSLDVKVGNLDVLLANAVSPVSDR